MCWFTAVVVFPADVVWNARNWCRWLAEKHKVQVIHPDQSTGRLVLEGMWCWFLTVIFYHRHHYQHHHPQHHHHPPSSSSSFVMGPEPIDIWSLLDDLSPFIAVCREVPGCLLWRFFFSSLPEVVDSGFDDAISSDPVLPTSFHRSSVWCFLLSWSHPAASSSFFLLFYSTFNFPFQNCSQ